MWVFAQNGFYSVVKFDQRKDPNRKTSSTRDGRPQNIKRDVEYVLVRCRVQEDIKYFARWMNDREQLSNVIWVVEEDDKADYLYRMVVPRAAWSEFLHDQSEDIEYTNFKSNISDHSRSGVYMRVWSAVMSLQPKRRLWSRVREPFAPSLPWPDFDEACCDDGTCEDCFMEEDDDTIHMSYDEMTRLLTAPVSSLSDSEYDMLIKIEDGLVEVREPDVAPNA